ncbi:MAG: transketolase, partial [Oscillospiraceae bacterium]|nr:transketolase [Oscillospiraceae bacterium]
MISDPKEFARAVRAHTAKTLMRTRDSHIGGGYSSADILAVLYTRILGLTPDSLDDPDRNVFLLSKGHIAATFYTTLAYAGLIPMEDLELHVADGENYAGHTRKFVVPGVEMSAGSLGHGASLG